jgi:carboxypeptidase C (cathepsin A)
MKKNIFTIVLLIGLLIVAGFGTRQVVQYFSGQNNSMEESVVKADTALPTAIPATASENTKDTKDETEQESTPVVKEYTAQELELDGKRGSFLTDSIRKQVAVLTQKEVVNQVEVGISDVIRYDTRAFVKMCIKQEFSDEPMNFGMYDITYPGGSASNAFVHLDVDPIDHARCVILEIESIQPSISSDDWTLIMELVGFVAPDEGTECDTFKRRAQGSDILKQNEIAFSCDHGNGQTGVTVTSKADNLSEQQADEILHDVLYGITWGPWVFQLDPIVVYEN